MSNDNTGVVDLAKQFATDPLVRNFLNTMPAFADMAKHFQAVLPQMSHNEQKFLACVVLMRLGGLMLPATVNLKHFPFLLGMDEQVIMATAQQLVEHDVLEPITSPDGSATCFAWPALESLIAQAMKDRQVSIVMPGR